MIDSLKQTDSPRNEPIKVILAGIVHKDKIRPAINSIIEDINQQVSDISHHVTQLSIRLVTCVHLEDQSKEEVRVDTCIHIVQIEWHFDDINDRFLPCNHPCCWKDHIRSFSFAQCLCLLSLQKIVDNKVSPWIDLVGASILIFHEGSVSVLEYFLIKFLKIEVMLLPKIVV